MVRNLFSSARSTLKAFVNFVNSVTTFPSYLRGWVSYVKDYLKNFRRNLSNLAETNLELGKFHLRMGNYTDAMLRFLLITKYLDKDSKAANYWLGWAYFLKGNHRKALISLSNAEGENKADLYNFIRTINTVSEVPTDVYGLHRDITSGNFIDKFGSETVNLPIQMITEFNKIAADLPEHYSILELGCNIGLLGLEVKKRMQESFEIKGVETSAELIKLQDLYLRSDEIYDRIIQSDLLQFLQKDQDKYDVILSLDGLSSNKDLNNIFSLISARLNTGGYFAICLKTSPEVRFSEKYLEFSYNSLETLKILEKSDLKLNDALEIKLEIKNNYTIFVGTKV
jgi:SAM-dependent methyltransferase